MRQPLWSGHKGFIFDGDYSQPDAHITKFGLMLKAKKALKISKEMKKSRPSTSLHRIPYLNIFKPVSNSSKKRLKSVESSKGSLFHYL